MHVVDNFLPHPLLDGLDDDPTIKMIRNNGIRWWDGVTEGNRVHEIINYCRDQFHVQGMCGFEYWFNVTEDDAGPWHVDKDEGADVLVPADWSCILYVIPHQIWGGFLEMECGDDTRTEVERISPRFNRCVVLDNGVWHRVSRVWSGQRHALLINGWKQAPSTANK